MEHQELAQLWRGRLRDAEIRLDFALNFMAEVQRDFPHPTVDGKNAHHSALQAEQLALAEYKRVLRIFTDLVLDGKIPCDNDGQRFAAMPDRLSA